MRKLFFGTLVHSVSPQKVSVLPHQVVGVVNGAIEFILSKHDFEKSEFNSLDNAECVYLKAHQFIVPGFIDTHTHAPQYVNCGLGVDMELLPWLEKYTFPAETKFEQDAIAKNIYSKCVRRHLKNGTTTAVYFATIHLQASLLLAHICKQLQQRAFIGKVNMDRNSPATYIEQCKTSLEETDQFIQQVLRMNRGTLDYVPGKDLVCPIVTPRFVPTCSWELMVGLGVLMNKYGQIPVQSHVSENKNEVKWVKELHPEMSYLQVYEKTGLLSNKCLLGHAIWLTDEELKLMSTHGATISHCPNSNLSIRSGTLDIRRAWQHNVKVSLGTDVSGGYAPSMLNAIRMAILSSTSNMFLHRDTTDIDAQVKQMYDSQTPSNAHILPKPLSLNEAFYLATLAGAESLGLENVLGNFVVGKQFDALIVDLNVEDTPVDSFDDLATDMPEEEQFYERFQRFVYCGDDRNIVAVYVQGNKVQF